jgi:hypothetical protein
MWGPLDAAIIRMWGPLDAGFMGSQSMNDPSRTFKFR